MIILISGFFAYPVRSQTVIGLDNWYNRETNPKDGTPYHYLWADTAFSGYSRWGKIFVSRGAKLTTLEKPSAAILSKIGVYIIVDPDTTTESKSPNYIMPQEAGVIELMLPLNSMR